MSFLTAALFTALCCWASYWLGRRTVKAPENHYHLTKVSVDFDLIQSVIEQQGWVVVKSSDDAAPLDPDRGLH